MAYATSLQNVQSDLSRSNLRARIADYFSRRRVFRTTLRELQALSDRELADLGLHRSMLRRIAQQAANEM
ncbi:MAG: DUF1127 domain-containing protein [Roseivivax sp.]|nr:DUF1127 domain-containing protein [Roseivivax sp.]